MVTWKDYYVEYEFRQDQLDEARNYRLIKAFLGRKEIRLLNPHFWILPRQFEFITETIYEHL